jgi:ketosteroid isomerase-like protein
MAVQEARRRDRACVRSRGDILKKNGRRCIFGLSSFASLLLALTAAGCVVGRHAPVTGRELVELDEAWAAAAARNDVDAVMAMWTEGAVVYPAGRPPIYGKPGIRDFFEDYYSQTGDPIAWSPTCAGVDPRGTMAYTLGTMAATAGESSGAQGRQPGHYVAIWRRNDGRWRCAVKCWNGD